MIDNVIDQLKSLRIDSYQKLRLLLLLQQNPGMEATSEEFAERLHLGDIPLVTEILVNFQQSGLVRQIGNSYRLRSRARLRFCLQSLASTFEDPQARQVLLDQVRYNVTAPASAYR